MASPFEVDEHDHLEPTDNGKKVIGEALFLVASTKALRLPGCKGPMV